jgi:hypothetical protein
MFAKAIREWQIIAQKVTSEIKQWSKLNLKTPSSTSLQTTPCL